MNKKIKINYLVASLIALSSCNNNSTKSGLAPNLVDDSLLKNYEMIEMHDNKIVMEHGDSADPFILRFNGQYYLYMTTGGKAIRGYKSSDMYNWEKVDNNVLQQGFVYDYLSDDSNKVPESSTPYAPEVFYFNGKFYLITSPSGKGHYVLESTSPEGPFKSISNNIGMAIDGSYFIDGKDEKIYLFTAGTSYIAGYEMKDDMISVKDKRNTLLLNCNIGNWTEGPYMLQKDGNYYMTYSGTHYLSPSYRVDYAYADAKEDVFSPETLKRQDTILLSTTDSFKGLGHSCTVLGPDMDSYYIVYHNLDDGNRRYLNYSRLSFNGSTMVANDVKESNIIKASAPSFVSYNLEGMDNTNGFYLSNKKTSDTFTCEFNVIGEGKMIFSYVDENNYCYIEYKDNDITINKITGGNKIQLHKIDLIREYNKDVLHTFRLQYKDEKMSFYFDSMEKAHDVKVKFNAGNIGYQNNGFKTIGYTAFSDVALGSSDEKAYNSQISLANSFDRNLSYLTKNSSFVQVNGNIDDYTAANSQNLLIADKGNRATYKTNLKGGKYTFNIKVPASSLNKTIGVRIDDGKINEISLPKNLPLNENGDVLVSLGIYEVSEGQHYISIYNIKDKIEFSELRYELINPAELNITFDDTFDSSTYFVKNNLNLTNEGFASNSQDVCGIISKNEYFNSTISTDITIKDIYYNEYAGIVFNANAYSHYPSADADGINFAYPYSGYLICFEKNGIYLYDVHFNIKNRLNKYSMSYSENETYNLKIVQNNNSYIIYLNNQEIMNISANVGNLSGGVGLFSKGADVIFKNLIIK